MSDQIEKIDWNSQSCGVKLAFDIPANSVLNWHEYFGWDDVYDFVHGSLTPRTERKKKHQFKFKSDTEFESTDLSGAKCTIVFHYYGDMKNISKAWNEIIAYLTWVNENPMHNPDVDHFNFCLGELDHNDVFVPSTMSDREVFEEYNLITFGHRTWQSKYHSINNR